MPPKILALFLLALSTFAAGAAEHRVASAADIARVSAEAQPGDVLVMADGEWKDQTIVFRANGSAEKPVTLRAETDRKSVV